jgi:aspartyl-tRNA(Asn)/glutamyl-tRNA(Gln) amidotransferase subunit A
MTPYTSVRAAAAAMARGEVRSRELVERALQRALDPGGEGARVFLKLYADGARDEADRIDRQRASGAALPEWAGVPVSIKDLFDVAGEPTAAGSTVLADAAPAAADAPVVARLKAAGFVLVGRTNMTEFAYSGLGLNPHFGTPLNPYDRATGRIPGGSSSGAAVSVGDGMALAGIGSDTGGSCRIPAALCGLAGFKPSARRVPLEGVLPLSRHLDSIGSISNTVDCCSIVDAVMAADRQPGPFNTVLSGLRLAVPQTLMLNDLEPQVAAAFGHALSRLSAAGARIDELPLAELDELRQINADGGFTAVESYAWHGALLAKRRGQYDPRVAARIMKGERQGPAELERLRALRHDWIARVASRCAPYDALLFPTVPRIAPPLSELAADEAYNKANLLMLRNCSVINFLDGCAVSIPCQSAGAAPVGLSFAGLNGSDVQILGIAAAAEKLFNASASAG